MRVMGLVHLSLVMAVFYVQQLVVKVDSHHMEVARLVVVVGQHHLVLETYRFLGVMGVMVQQVVHIMAGVEEVQQQEILQMVTMGRMVVAVQMEQAE